MDALLAGLLLLVFYVLAPLGVVYSWTRSGRRMIRRRLKVALIGPFGLWPKGTVRCRTVPLAEALERRGHDVRVFLVPWDTASTCADDVETGGFLVRSLPVRRIFPLARGVLDLFWAVGRWGPDVVHVFKPVGVGAAAGYGLRLLWRLPVVVDIDDVDGPRGWAGVGTQTLLRCVAGWQEQYWCRQAKAVTVATGWLGEYVRAQRGDSASIFVFTNAPSLAVIGSAERREVDHVVYLGYIPSSNDLDVLVSAVAGVGSHRKPMQVTIAGDGPGRVLLEAEVARVGLSDQIVFAGYLGRDEARLLLSRASVGVYPCRDTLRSAGKSPAKVVEYMQAGLGIVACDTAGSREYLRDGETGVLVPPGDSEALGRAIMTLIEQPDCARELGRAAQTAAATLQWSACAQRAEDAYHSALESHE